MGFLMDLQLRESVPARAVPVEEEGPVGGQSGVPPRAIEEPEASAA